MTDDRPGIVCAAKLSRFVADFKDITGNGNTEAECVEHSSVCGKGLADGDLSGIIGEAGNPNVPC